MHLGSLLITLCRLFNESRSIVRGCQRDCSLTAVYCFYDVYHAVFFCRHATFNLHSDNDTRQHLFLEDTIMPQGLLHHIELYVSDLDLSREFWGWFLEELNYEKYQEWENGVSWKLGDTYLVFVQTEEKYLQIPYHRCGTGLNHLAFYALSKNHVDDMTERLKSKQITVLYENRHPYAGGPDHYAVYFEDPDRIKVELVAP